MYFSNILDSINFGVSMQKLILNVSRHIAHMETEEKMFVLIEKESSLEYRPIHLHVYSLFLLMGQSYDW